MAKKKISVERKIDALTSIVAKGFTSLGARIGKIDARMERGFSAVAGDIADIKQDVATKDQIIVLHTQVNSIETELRGMKHTKLQSRIAVIEKHLGIGNKLVA